MSPTGGLLVEAAELELESKETVPRFAEQLGRMYDLMLEHLDELRAEMGEKAAERLKEEAETVAPRTSKCSLCVHRGTTPPLTVVHYRSAEASGLHAVRGTVAR